jgi:hypothetical protein
MLCALEEAGPRVQTIFARRICPLVSTSLAYEVTGLDVFANDGSPPPVPSSCVRLRLWCSFRGNRAGCPLGKLDISSWLSDRLGPL